MSSRRVLRGTVVAPDAVIGDGVVAFARNRIAWVGAYQTWTRAGWAKWPPAQSSAGYILPGLVDVHCHGAVGHDFGAGLVAGGERAAAHHRRNGTLGMLASIVTAPVDDLLAAVAACADLVDAGELVGIHLEGPFLAPERRGAHAAELLRKPDTELLDRLLRAGRGHIKTMTYAPELEGAQELAARALERGVVVSVGHTNGDHATVARALRSTRGSSSVTHLFNAMPPVHHRAPGPAAAAISEASRGGTVVELVADGVHLADETVRMIFDVVGRDHIALVTDAMSATGCPDGRYRLGRLDVDVADRVARLASGVDVGTIAGGTSHLLELVRRCVHAAGVSVLEAVTAASRTPARLLGSDRGVLHPGAPADIVITDRALVATEVIRGGITVGQAPPREQGAF